MKGFLKANTRLQALSIHGSPAQTVALFRAVHFSPSVQSITLALPVNATLSLPQWSEIDVILSLLPSLQSLEIAHLKSGATHVQSGTDLTWLRFDELSAHMLEILPSCAARGIVTQSVVAQI